MEARIMAVGSFNSAAIHARTAGHGGKSALAHPTVSRFLRDRNRNAGNLHIDRSHHGPAGEKQRFPVLAAEADIGGRRLAMDDAAEFLALRIEHIDSACAA